MKINRYSLREFLKLYTDKAHSFIFSHENQDDSVSLPSVQYEIQFSAVNPVTQSAQNGIKFFNEDGDFITINNVEELIVGEQIPGFGTVVTLICGDGAIPANAYYRHKFIMR